MTFYLLTVLLEWIESNHYYVFGFWFLNFIRHPTLVLTISSENPMYCVVFVCTPIDYLSFVFVSS